MRRKLKQTVALILTCVLVVSAFGTSLSAFSADTGDFNPGFTDDYKITYDGSSSYQLSFNTRFYDSDGNSVYFVCPLCGYENVSYDPDSGEMGSLMGFWSTNGDYGLHTGFPEGFGVKCQGCNQLVYADSFLGTGKIVEINYYCGEIRYSNGVTSHRDDVWYDIAAVFTDYYGNTVYFYPFEQSYASEMIEGPNGHLYRYPTFTWDSYDLCVATFKCVECGDIQNVDCKITSEVTTEPTETINGERTYTATCEFNEVTYTDTKTEVIPATGGPTIGFVEENGKWYYYNENGSQVMNGIVQDTKKVVDGTDGWFYIVNGTVDFNYTGVSNFANDYGWWYIKNGKVDFSCNSVEQNDYGWWYIVGGKVDFSYTGVADYANAYGWWYISKGKVDFSKTSIEPNKYGWWRVVNGKVDFSCNSVEQNDYGWWYIVGGKVDFSYTGVANYANAYGWWYVKGGKVDFSKTSIEPNQYGWWRVVNGKVDFSCNSVEQNDYGWWYVVGGKVDFSYTGVSNYSNAYGWWYIKDGKVDFSFTGWATNSYGMWYCVNGKVDFSKS